MFGIFIYDFIFFAIPTAAILFFGISLYLYCTAKSKNKKTPGTFSPTALKDRLILLIVSSVILGVLVLIAVGFIVLMYMAIAYM